MLRTLLLAGATSLALAGPSFSQGFARQVDVATDIEGSDATFLHDVDGDGVDDLVRGLRGLRVHRGLGLGQFERQTWARPFDDLFSAGDQGDVDGDGDDDLVFASVTERLLWTYRQGAGGLDQIPTASLDTKGPGTGSLEERAHPKDLRLVDMDLDGDLDAVLSRNSGSPAFLAEVIYFPNDGTGGFGLPRPIFEAAEFRTLRLEIADLNGDGRPDVVARSLSSDQLTQVLNGPGGVFGQGTVVAADGETPRAMKLADMDGDGVIDMVTGTLNRHVEVRFGIAGGGFAPVIQLSGLVSSFVGGLYLSDFTGDGVLDVMAVSLGAFRIFRGLGNREFSNTELLPLFGNGIGVGHLLDVNEDGLEDIVIEVDGAGRRAISIATGQSGTRPFDQLIRMDEVARFQTQGVAALADLDGDGQPEIVAGGQSQALGFSIHSNPGPFFTFAEVAIPGNDEVVALWSPDLDGDGRDDLVMLDTDGVLRALRSLGAGQLGAPVAFGSASTQFPALTWFDRDADGDVDLVTTDPALRVTSIENQGGFNFGSQQALFTSSCGVTSVSAADIDGVDGVDLVLGLGCAGLTLPSVLWLPSNGSGFNPAQVIASSTKGARDVEAADYDGDGDIDVIYTDGQSPSFLHWIPNQGAGTFLPSSQLRRVNGPTVIDVADVNQDGLMDVAFSNNFVSGVFRNEGGSRLNEFHGHLGAGNGPILLGDLDSDGDLDVAKLRSMKDLFFYENVMDTAIGAEVCGPAVTTMGRVPGIVARGSVVLSDNSLVLEAFNLPITGAVGFFLASPSLGLTFPVVNSIGRLCLSGPIGRFVGPGEVYFSADERGAYLDVDLGRVPTPGGRRPILGGETWYFQSWFRIPTGVSNFTDAVEISFQ